MDAGIAGRLPQYHLPELQGRRRLMQIKIDE